MNDQPRVRIGIEIDGQFRYYEGLSVSASGQKTSDHTKNDCKVTISTLSQSTIDYIVTQTSPLNTNRTSRKLAVDIGTERTGLVRIFYGDITEAQPGLPPDHILSLSAQTTAGADLQIVSNAGGATTPLSTIAQQVATDLGVILRFEATDKLVGSWSYMGPAGRQVMHLGDVGGVDAFVDDEELIVKDRDVGLSNRVKILNADSGMVGIPKLTEKGVTVSCLIDTSVRIGGTIRIQSEINKAANGDWVIRLLKYDAALNPGSSKFFYTIEAVRA